MNVAIVAVKLAAVKVKSLDEIKVEKEKPAAVEDQPKNKDEVNTVMYGYATYMYSSYSTCTYVVLRT